MLHAFVIHRGIIHVITAAADKEEFTQFYDTFFAAIRSLRITSSPEEMISTPSKKEALEKACADLKEQWTATKKNVAPSARPQKEKRDAIISLFEGEEFQSGPWQAFSKQVEGEFSDMGDEWREALLNAVRSDLITTG